MLAALAVTWAAGFAVFRLGPYARLVRLPGASPLPEESVAVAGTLADYLERIGPAGRSLYAGFQGWDFASALLGAGTSLLALAWLTRQAGTATHPVRAVVLLPLLVLAGEIVENGLILTALAAYPAPSAAAGLVAGVTLCKLACFLFVLLAAAGLAVGAIVRLLRARIAGARG